MIYFKDFRLPLEVFVQISSKSVLHIQNTDYV